MVKVFTSTRNDLKNFQTEYTSRGCFTRDPRPHLPHCRVPGGGPSHPKLPPISGPPNSLSQSHSVCIMSARAPVQRPETRTRHSSFSSEDCTEAAVRFNISAEQMLPSSKCCSIILAFAKRQGQAEDFCLGPKAITAPSLYFPPQISPFQAHLVAVSWVSLLVSTWASIPVPSSPPGQISLHRGVRDPLLPIPRTRLRLRRALPSLLSGPRRHFLIL